MKLFSTAFRDGQEIPIVHTGEGSDASPPLAWSGVPPKAQSLALIIEDPDAPDPAAPRMTWTHWILYNLPPGMDGLPGAVKEGALPPTVLPGKNSWNRRGYGGPMPPVGRHRYIHKLYALDTALPDMHTPTRDQLLAAMKGHVVDTAELTGTYQKRR
jgi:Raf kinase inhibitor-like YbhB/YbcL family protein